VENEIHFLIECQKYTLLREVLYREVITMDNFTLLPQFQKFIYLMSSDSPMITHSVLLFISHAEQIRNKSLDSVVSTVMHKFAPKWQLCCN